MDFSLKGMITIILCIHVHVHVYMKAHLLMLLYMYMLPNSIHNTCTCMYVNHLVSHTVMKYMYMYVPLLAVA